MKATDTPPYGVSSRKPAEREFQTARMYKALVESILDPVFICDASGRYLYVNRAAADNFGTTPEGLIGRTVDELFPPANAEHYRRSVECVIRTGETLNTLDSTVINGRSMWFSIIMQPYRDAEGRVTAVQCVVRDVTSLREAELALRRSEERLQQAVHVAHIGFFDHDHVTGRIYLSSEFTAMAGWPEDVVPASGIVVDHEFFPSFLDSIHVEDRDRIAQAIQEAHAGTGGSYDVEFRVVRPDGDTRWLAAQSQTTFEVADGRSRATRTVGAVLDVSERRRADEERERLQAQLAQAQKIESVGRLAGGVAHDFNNMLNVICGYTEVALKKVSPGHSLHEDLEEIRRAAQRSAALTQQLLAFARKQPVTPKIVNLNEVVELSLGMVRRIIGGHITAHWNPAPDLMNVRVDPAQIDQILMNLAANARDAIGEVGQVSIRTANVSLDAQYCSNHPGATPGPFVLLEVCDDGCGMNADTRSRIFEPFFTTKASASNAGLGMATVYGIVKQNGGFVVVESELGRGTRVEVLLPRSDETPALTDPEPRSITGVETILLVEDEPLVLKLTKGQLERLGYGVLPASSPAEAMRLAELHRGKFQMLLSDMVMPDMHGRELAARLLERDPALKCLFMSGYYDPSKNGRSPDHLNAYVLQKPFSLEELSSRVRATLESR